MTAQLREACARGNAARARELLDAGADLNAHSRYGRAPLVEAVKGSSPDCVRTLLGSPALTQESLDLALRAAIRHPAILEMLLKRGADPNYADVSATSMLDWAVMGEKPRAVRMLLDYGACIGDRDKGGAVLRRACETGQRDVVEMILHEGADPNAAGPNGETPLILAGAYVSLVGVLIHAGADANAADDSGRTAFFMACACGSADAARALLSTGADPHTHPERQDTPLGLVLNLNMEPAHSRPDLVAMMLERGAAAQIEERDTRGQTPLASAVFRGLDAETTLLLDAGADTSATTLSRECPVALAAMTYRADILRKLLEWGASPEPPPEADHTPLFDACIARCALCVEALLEAGADVEKPTALGSSRKEEWTPLAFSIADGFPEGIRMLLDAGAAVPGRLPSGYPPLVASARLADADASMLRMLLEAGAQPGYDPQTRTTPLFKACETKAAACVEVLLDADTSLINTMCALERHRNPVWTPLQRACYLGAPTCVRLLLEAGACLSSVLPGGTSMLCVATFNDDLESLRLLLEHGADPNKLGAIRPDWPWKLPLQVAVDEVRPEHVKLLLMHGADIHTASENSQAELTTGLEALDPPHQCGGREIMTILLRGGLSSSFVKLGASADFDLALAVAANSHLTAIALEEQPPDDLCHLMFRSPSLLRIASRGGGVSRRPSERRHPQAFMPGDRVRGLGLDRVWFVKSVRGDTAELVKVGAFGDEEEVAERPTTDLTHTGPLHIVSDELSKARRRGARSSALSLFNGSLLDAGFRRRVEAMLGSPQA